MASALLKCRICLSVNVKMFTFKNTNIKNLYQLLTQVDIDDGKPAVVCFLCYARLQQCFRLQQKAIKSNEILEQLLTGGIVQARANAIINNQHTSQDLQVSTMYHLDLEPTTCEDVLIEPKVESWYDCPVSVKVETEAIDEERKNVHLIMDFSEDGYDPYGYFPKACHSDSKEYKQMAAIGAYHCDGINDVGHGLEQRKQQHKDFSGDEYDPNDFAPKPIHSDSEDNQLLIAIGSNESDGIKDIPITHGLERSKDQEKEYQCTYKCASQSNLKIPTVEKPFSCDICEYKFARKIYLKDHMRTHTGEKPFSCNICEFRCTKKFALKRHMNKHTGEKPFSCNVCGYRCITKFDLNKHMRKHTGEKPFSCNICEYKCALKHTLNDHMRIHTGAKPFSCSICAYKSKCSSNLKRHLRTHK